jgi:hypothetical protein
MESTLCGTVTDAVGRAMNRKLGKFGVFSIVAFEIMIIVISVTNVILAALSAGPGLQTALIVLAAVNVIENVYIAIQSCR